MFSVAIIALLVNLLQWNALRDQITRANPPRIWVGQIVMWEQGTYDVNRVNKASPWQAGTKIQGRVSAINHGPEPAFVKHNDAFFYWHKGRLSMNRDVRPTPNQIRHRTGNDDMRLGDVVSKLEPGDSGSWIIQHVIPPDFAELTLYVLGHITFRDSFNVFHGVAFAHKYEPDAQAFSEVTDARDYSHTE
jgi:hypothetical protein